MKPHLFKVGGVWFCVSDRFNYYGHFGMSKNLYYAWQNYQISFDADDLEDL